MTLLGVYVVAALYLLCAGLIMAKSPQHFTTGLARLNLLTAVAALALAGLTSGIYFNYDFYIEDFWTATEALNKASGGLLSSVDFYSPVGPFYYYVFALSAMIDSTPTASTVMHAGALFALIGCVLCVVMLRRHVSALGLSIVVLSLVAVAVSGRGNGELLHLATLHFLAPYNRWAWALFIPVAVRLSLRHEGDLAGDVALGLAIAILLMTKVTYGAAALGLVAARCMIVPASWREIPVLAATLAIVLGAIELGSGQVSAYLRDLETTALLPESGLRIDKLFKQLGEMALYSVVGIVVYLATIEPVARRRSRQVSAWSHLRPILMILLVAGFGCLILMQNHYLTEAAVYPILPLIALEWNGALQRGSTRVPLVDFRRRVLITAATLFIVFYPVVDVGMHVGQRLQYHFNEADPAFAGTPYADLKFDPDLVRNEKRRINTIPAGRAGILSGLEMLVEAGAKDPQAGSVATLAFSNPFPMLLGRPSPVGTPIWLSAGRTFSKDEFVSPEDFFEGVEFVMIEPGQGLLIDIYRDTIEAEFEERSSNEFWTLLVRRKQ